MITKSDTIEAGRVYVKAHAYKGVKCPCCTQLVKIYKRRIYSTMAIGLMKLYSITMRNDSEFNRYFHISDIESSRRSGGGDFAKLLYWELVEERPNTDEHKKHSGYWNITPQGKEFVQKKITVPEHALIFNDRLIGMSGEAVNIEDALGKKFNYKELMRTI